MKPNHSLLIILAVVVIVSACNGAGGGTQPLYVVRVEDAATNKGIYNAKVIVEAISIGKISEVSDVDGYARLFIPAGYVGKPGRLIVEVEGYKVYRSEINLYVDQLPTRVLLDMREAAMLPPVTPGATSVGSITPPSTLPIMPSATPIVTSVPPVATSTAVLTLPPVPDTPTPAEPPKETTDTKGIEMVLIPAGEFQMGSVDGETNEKPVHAVYLDAFYIDVYEVTNASYAECVQAGGCTAPESSNYGKAEYANHPVVGVSWEQAQAYCTWRGDGYRLPSEAEWEKAARGGLVGKKYPWGDEAPKCKRANYSGCIGDTSPVGRYTPNGYGLYDMAGNVWEWVQDWYQADYYSSLALWRNPFGPETGQYRVARGGAWFDDEGSVRSANRFRLDSSYRVGNLGFRPSRSP